MGNIYDDPYFRGESTAHQRLNQVFLEVKSSPNLSVIDISEEVQTLRK
jgi:hypothetical protein